MAAPADTLLVRARAALDSVLDPELDEPITDLGFVRSMTVDDGVLTVHLRLPTSFCAPNFAYLMAADAKEALTGLPGAGRVVVELDDHHDSEIVNRGLAADAGYRATFGAEAGDSLDELRAIFRRKAHTAAMERALTLLLRRDPDLTEHDLHRVTVADLPESREKQALLQRRAGLGLGVDGPEPVLVDPAGRPCPADQAAAYVRRARAVRISMDGNAHFCRGLLRTRYPESAADQAPRAGDRPLLPLISEARAS